MMMDFDRPLFADNRDGRSMLAALRGHLDWLANTYKDPVSVDIATGYFNPAGFAMIAEELLRTDKVRLLLGAEPTTPPKQSFPKPGEKRGKAYDVQRIDQALQDTEEGLKEDRDILGFSPEVDQTIHKLLDFLESGKVEVRRYSHGFLHGKAFLFIGGDGRNEGVISGSSNFTAAGLYSNRELNLGHYDPRVVNQVADWFQDMWDESEPYDLAEIYEARFREYSPYLIYLRVLYELYGEEIRQEAEQKHQLQLTTFQNDGLFRAERILDQYNGVIIADGVGLGKTFIGGALIEQTIREQRQRVLLIAPAVLRDGAWTWFRHEYNLQFEVLSYQEFENLPEFGGHGTTHLWFDPNEYTTVIIDEAHAFRNPDTNRARALRRMLQGSPPKKLVLMTATPVNNSLWDLFNMLSYFVGHDAAFAHQGIRSLRQRFHDAVSEDPFDLRPDMLFDVLDATTVRRTRHFVKRYYPNEQVPGLNGVIRFPDPHVMQVEYSLDNVLPGFFDEFAQALAPEEGEPLLTLARYWPSRYKYRPDPEDQQREAALVGLLRSGLLKRFESSVHAFANTAARMAQSHDAFLAAMDRGFIPTPQAILEWGETDNDEVFDELLLETDSEPITLYDADTLRRDVQRDRDLLRQFANTASGITQDQDPKLHQLVDELVEIASQAETEGLDAEDRCNKRKVIIFSYFSDTVGWLEKHLFAAIQSDPRLSAFADRAVSVSSSSPQHSISREDAVFGFAPVSTRAPASKRDNRFDILITTDVLAEGENLQQCRHIINYDLPWNPMRLVQRNGRIDRIGSPHRDVYIRCFFPDRELDALLTLEERIRMKLAQAAASIGVESEVIPDGAVSNHVFTETREQIQALQREDAEILISGGEEPNAFSGEEYRQELRHGLLNYRDEITSLPWAAGSGFIGLEKGHFFCAKIGEHVYLRFVPFNENAIISDLLGCLRMVTCAESTQRHMPDELRNSAYNAWSKARNDIYDEWGFSTDPANLQPRVRPLLREAAQHLRSYPPEINQPELIAVLDALEAPLERRIEKQFREIMKQDDIGNYPMSARIVEKVQELGLQPFEPPQPLPPIDEEEIQLIVWMAVDSYP
ncbi:MAG: helicase [Anaerolineaceae bacterium]|nr:helicase [Anaerolineaceae bacterium]